MDTSNEKGNGSVIVPPCSIATDEGKVTLKLEMPGCSKESIDVKIEGNELSISGERSMPQEGVKYLLRERRTGKYRKALTMDDSVSRDGMEASYADGVLCLTLRLKEAAMPKRIEIS